jgi:hypothetical protein
MLLMSLVKIPIFRSLEFGGASRETPLVRERAMHGDVPLYCARPKKEGRPFQWLKQAAQG